MKELIRYLQENPARALVLLAAVVFGSIGVWFLPANLGLTGAKDATGGVETSEPLLPAPEARVQGQYCQNGQPYVNFKFDTVFTGKIDWSGPGDEGPEESVTFIYRKLAVKYASPSGYELVIDSPANADPTIDMTCTLVKREPDGLLFNCKGPQDSTVTILVNGRPFDVPFMACDGGQKEPEPGREPCSAFGCP